MSRLKILVNDEIDNEAIDLLRSKGFQVDVKEYSQQDLVKNISSYEVLIVRSRSKVDRDVIEAGKDLKIIARAGVGLDNIDVEAAKQRNIIVLNAPEAPSIAVCELVFGLMLSIARQICLASNRLKSGEWIKKQLSGFELYGKNLAIIGYGNIGRQVGLRAKAFGMNVHVYDVAEQSLMKAKEEGFNVYGPDRINLTDMLKKADIITVHVPLLPATKKLIGEREFEYMKTGVVIINTSRGGVIDEQALLTNLNNGKVAGAGLDVYEIEPPVAGVSKNLVEHPKTVCTPHIGASTMESQRKAGMIIAEKIISILKP
ncbi:MAG: hydroxyacid dehydrogenase [Candidatus Odinarchaeum yellowstonii]|uniref:Hydroxyacid dehydrogenase n=1 Tax=Odinarchaeota yellowstonii (strain LCB_4) TaxID=1841599 RepID=A0AAF0D119_ODILC|nr:MAG: hydroxyacid dehydrogenase [Candidatus Odinarchaeum yellowstonii]